jgi:sec-independent protein translocase protein TatB
MFNFSGSELMFLLILGLVVLGPEKLPTVLRKMGKFYGEFKRMTGDAQSDFRQAFAEPLRDLQSAATEYKSVFQEAAGEITDYSPEPEPEFVPWQPPAEDENSISESSAVDVTGRVDALSPDDEPEISVISYEEKN